MKARLCAPRDIHAENNYSDRVSHASSAILKHFRRIEALMRGAWYVLCSKHTSLAGGVSAPSERIVLVASDLIVAMRVFLNKRFAVIRAPRCDPMYRSKLCHQDYSLQESLPPC